jgi:hypothetical protein
MSDTFAKDNQKISKHPWRISWIDDDAMEYEREAKKTLNGSKS